MTRVRPFTPSILLPALVAVALAAPEGAALAQKRSALAGQPVVRHKMELRDKRFELAPTFEMSVAADYKNTLSFGAKAEYHLTDMLSIGGMFFFGTSLDTGLADQISQSLPEAPPPDGDPTPSRGEFTSHLNSTPLHGAVHATLTPWFGKMAAFGKAYVNFDIYLQGGLGFAQTTNKWNGGSGRQTETCYETCVNPDNDQTFPCNPYDCFVDPNNDEPVNAGFNPGIMLGAGLHAFVNRWIAIDISFKEYLFSDNPSGLDFDADGDVDGDDKRFLGHLYFGIGASMYFPPKTKISR